MPSAIVHKKALRAIERDPRFRPDEALKLARHYLPELIALVGNNTDKAVDYVGILQLHVTIADNALRGGYPHFGTPDIRFVRTKLRKIIDRQKQEIKRVKKSPAAGHPNVEYGNLKSLLNNEAIRHLDQNELTFKHLVEANPGCILIVLTTWWSY